MNKRNKINKFPTTISSTIVNQLPSTKIDSGTEMAATITGSWVALIDTQFQRQKLSLSISPSIKKQNRTLTNVDRLQMPRNCANISNITSV
jgi:ribonuclease PH